MDCVIIGWYWSSSWMPVCWTSLLIFSCDLYSFGTVVCSLCFFFFLFFSVSRLAERSTGEMRTTLAWWVSALWRQIEGKCSTKLKLAEESFSIWTFLELLFHDLGLLLSHDGFLYLETIFILNPDNPKLKALCGTFPLQTLTARYWFVLRHIWKLLTAMVLLMSRVLQESWALRKVGKEFSFGFFWKMWFTDCMARCGCLGLMLIS